MGRKKNPVPSYLHHRATNRAYIKVGKVFTYLGVYGSKESKERYAQLVGVRQPQPVPAPVAVEWAAVGGTVADIAGAFLDRHMTGYSKSERAYYVAAVGILVKAAGHLPVESFGPRALAEVREVMVGRGWTRQHVNAQVRRTRMIFRWAESVELAPAGKWHQLRSLAGLTTGKTAAKDQRRKTGVPDWVVERTIPHLSGTVAAMVRFQRLTGCRPQDVCALRWSDIDRTGDVWVFRPPGHKTAHRGHTREVYIGPQAQAVILPLVAGREDQPAVFSPRVAWGERRAKIAGGRKGYVPKGPPLAVRPWYDTMSYLRAVERGIARANEGREEADRIPDWRPNALRHQAAVEIRQKHGLDVAQKLLGHRQASTTEIYAKVSDAEAVRAALADG